MSDDRLHMTAAMTVLDAGLSPRDAYARGMVPGLSGNGGVEPAIYAIVDLERRGGAPPLRNVRTTRRSHRLTVRGVGRTVAEAQWVLAKASTAIEGAVLTVGDALSTPLVFEAAEGVSADEGRYSGAVTFTYGT